MVKNNGTILLAMTLESANFILFQGHGGDGGGADDGERASLP